MKQISLIILLFLISSCGYTFQGSGTILPDDVRKISIPLAVNQTTEPGLSLLLTEALRARFERYGVVQIVDQEYLADAVLIVTITSLDTRVQDVTGRTDIELSSELIMNVSGDLKRQNGQILWRNPYLSVRESFASSGDVVVTSSAGFSQGGITSGTLGTLGSRELARGQEQETLEELVDEEARQIYFQSVAEDF